MVLGVTKVSPVSVSFGKFFKFFFVLLFPFSTGVFGIFFVIFFFIFIEDAGTAVSVNFSGTTVEAKFSGATVFASDGIFRWETDMVGGGCVFALELHFPVELLINPNGLRVIVNLF